MELEDKDLEKVSGGANKTGDTQGEPGSESFKVYFKVPILTNLSGFYSRSQLEDLANQYVSLASMIKGYITNDHKQAALKLYNNDLSLVPANVRTFLGM